MKKMLALILSLLLLIMLSSCFEDSSTTPSTKTSYWKLTGKEIWWQYKLSTNIPGDVAWSQWENINSFPYGATYTISYYNDTYRYALIGSEYNLTVTDSSYAMARKWTTNFSWDPLTVNMTADTLYKVAAETKGDGGNMMHISNPYKASGSTNDWIVYANKNGGKTYAQVKIPKPIDETNPEKMAIKVVLTTGYAVIDYRYIYEWVTE